MDNWKLYLGNFFIQFNNKLTPEVSESPLLLFHLYNLGVEEVKERKI